MNVEHRKTESKITGAEAERIQRDPPRNMNLAQCAAYIGISSRKLRADTRIGRMPVAHLGGRLIFRLEDVDKALARLSA